MRWSWNVAKMKRSDKENKMKINPACVYKELILFGSMIAHWGKHNSNDIAGTGVVFCCCCCPARIKALRLPLCLHSGWLSSWLLVCERIDQSVGEDDRLLLAAPSTPFFKWCKSVPPPSFLILNMNNLPEDKGSEISPSEVLLYQIAPLVLWVAISHRSPLGWLEYQGLFHLSGLPS